MASHAKAHSLFDRAIVGRAIVDSFLKLDPRRQVRNPVMFTVYVGSILTTGLFVLALRSGGRGAAVVHSAPSRPGCGLPCCSPILPRRWPKDAARPRPTPCDARGTTCRAKKLLAATSRGTRPSSIARPCFAAAISAIVPAPRAAQGRSGAGRGRRLHPHRRRSHRRAWPRSMKAPSPAKARR